MPAVSSATAYSYTDHKETDLHTYTESIVAARDLSCVFRSWRVGQKSPIGKLRGAALTFEIGFECWELDENKSLLGHHDITKLTEELQRWYDNTVVVAKDDPMLRAFNELHAEHALTLVTLDQVGEMAFARHACNFATDWLRINVLSWRVRCYSVTCRSGDIACTFTNPRNEGA